MGIKEKALIEGVLLGSGLWCFFKKSNSLMREGKVLSTLMGFKKKTSADEQFLCPELSPVAFDIIVKDTPDSLYTRKCS